MSREPDLPLSWLAGIILVLALAYWGLTACLEQTARDNCKDGTLVETTTTRGRAWTCLPR